MVQNHLLQVVALLAMEPPANMSTECIRDERAKLLQSVRTLTPADVVRGQFRGYRKEPGVAQDSQVETFAAVRLHIDNWRWGGVPVFIRAGKCLPVTATEVMVELIGPPAFFDVDPDNGNHYRFRLSPEVVIGLGTRVKAPGRAHGRTNYVELIARHDADRRRHGAVRAPARRRRARRRHPVLARGRRRGVLADRRPDPRPGHASPPVRARHLGTAPGRTS